jgi:hypothetical protein
MMGALALMLFLFTSSSVVAQNFVNEDRAVLILDAELKNLNDTGFDLYNTGNYQAVYDLGYRYRYVTEIISQLSQGISVSEAIEKSLPTLPFTLGNLETSQTISETNLSSRVSSLRNYGIDLLTE